jgi:hypothetical protein
MGHPDFRAGGKIFATFRTPDEDRGMVKLTPEQQRAFIHRDPDVFEPVKGGWGRKGATYVCLEDASQATVRSALVTAWRNVAPKGLVEQFEESDEGAAEELD